MLICHLYGCPEIAVLTGWDELSVHVPVWKVRPECELILATDNSTGSYHSMYAFMNNCGFVRAPQTFINPNTNNRVNFFACRAEDFTPPSNIPPLVRDPTAHVTQYGPSVEWRDFPSQCGLAVILQPSAIKYSFSKIGRIAVVSDDKPALMQQFLDAGYKLAYKLRTKSVMYFHQAKEQLK